MAGTELDVGCEGNIEVDGCSMFAVEGGGSTPPERNDGQRDLSSGREVPVESGDR